MTSWRGDTGRSYAPNNNNGCSCIAVTNARHPSRNSGLHGQAYSNHGTRTTEATAVAVEDGKVLAVGSLDSLSPLIASRGARIDRQFEDKVMTPGFIDPHVHPTLPAVLTQFPFLAPDDWYLPTGDFPGATTPEGYRSALQNLVAQHDDASVPFVAFGYHPLWHGEVWRDDLNNWFGDTPVMIWHRSFHELIGNDAAWELLGVTKEDAEAIPHGASWERGHFYELGLRAVFPRMGFLFEPARYMKGMQNFLSMMHESGVTTAADMGTGIFGNPVGEIQAIKAAVASDPVGVRVLLTPIITDFITRQKSAEQALAEVRDWQTMNDDQVTVGNHFKLMIDGAIFRASPRWGHLATSTGTRAYGWSMSPHSRHLPKRFGTLAFRFMPIAMAMPPRHASLIFWTTCCARVLVLITA